MATEHDPPTKEADERKDVSSEEAEHEKQVNRDKDHGGFSEDVGPDAEHAEPSSTNPPGS